MKCYKPEEEQEYVYYFSVKMDSPFDDNRVKLDRFYECEQIGKIDEEMYIVTKGLYGDGYIDTEVLLGIRQDIRGYHIIQSRTRIDLKSLGPFKITSKTPLTPSTLERYLLAIPKDKILSELEKMK